MGKIASISYASHNVFNDSHVTITDAKTFSKDNFITLLIGENGSGKSELLKSIVQFYRKDQSDITIWSGMKVVTTGITKQSKWPQKVVAYSLSINDKFPYQKNNWDGEESYFYAGLKTTSNTIYIGKYREDLLKCFYLICKDDNREELILKCLNLMGLPTSFIFKLSFGWEFKKYISIQEETRSYKELIKGFISTKETKKNIRIFNLINDTDELDFITSVLDRDRANSHDTLDLQIKLVEKYKDNQTNINNMKVLISLIDLKILSVSEFSEISQDDLLNLSSGQFNLIRNIATLVSQLNDNSLVIIDEPEISLHPSWQIKYMDLISKIIKPFKGCHVIVASHSHLLVTSLPIDKSNVLISNRKDVISITPFDASPTGWSSDMILYGVFGVLTRGNVAFEADLRTVTSLIKNKDDRNDLKLHEAISRLERYALPGNDPLNEFITKAKNRIKGEL
ncbi:AAA family ATPase [Citrobacter sp. HN-141]|uniref:ATP-binding protein n=1 Tax=unclassified Citrobacter TaxID=2644389 RepID=UPI002963D961|nr:MULTISPECIES: AAA family ATPase [unclassified Citrobacter]MDW2645370.1 AAA family ATPase [Citrobacter sp. HN-141]MDW2654810.1 AAA family ATPase [Citrobacter sp. HN-120]MDW2697945.1 AAA family ATPase [Citrobacter sp. HN-144]